MADLPIGPRASSPCANCGAEVTGNFCAECGQRTTDHRRPLRALLGDLQNQALALDARVWRTLGLLFRKPGFLTAEYNAGRRVHYLPPVRLYLLISFFFFLSLQWVNPEFIRINRTSGGEPVQTEESPVQTQESEAATSPSTSEHPVLVRIFLDKLAELDSQSEDAQNELNRLVGRRVPQSMFFQVPMLAFIVQLLFFRRRIFYVEHLVFAVHIHSFAFVALLVATLMRPFPALDPVRLPLLLVSPIYLWFAMRRVYRVGWWATSWRTLVTIMLYTLSLAVVFLIVVYLVVVFS